jgi:hypothetical protein
MFCPRRQWCFPHSVLLIAFALTFQFSRIAAAQTPAKFSNQDASQLVRDVIYNEQNADKNYHSRFKYRSRKVTPKGSTLKEIVETNDGTVSRLVSINDQPLTAEQRAQEDKRLEKLLTDPDEQRHKLREQQEDARKAEIMLRALPDAFLYEEIGRDGDVVRLHFHPSPHFNPPNRETSVFRGMDGTMLIDIRQKRMVKMDGHLFQDVTFGWGILARLEKGGSFVVEQKQIEGPRWEAVKVDINMSGHALFFKTISMHETDYTFDYHRVPLNLTLRQGVDLLQKGEPQVAASSGPKLDSK